MTWWVFSKLISIVISNDKYNSKYSVSIVSIDIGTSDIEDRPAMTSFWAVESVQQHAERHSRDTPKIRYFAIAFGKDCKSSCRATSRCIRMSKHPGGAFMLEEFLMESLPISSLEGVGAPQKKKSRTHKMNSCLLVCWYTFVPTKWKTV